MKTVFIYSDETGEYRPKPYVLKSGKEQYFIRSVLILDADDWRTLKAGLDKAKTDYGLKVTDECKWSHCWSAISSKRTGTPIKITKPYSYLTGLAEAQILSYLDETLKSITSLGSVKTFYICSKSNYTRHTKECIEKWHIQNLMQRCQLEVKDRESEALGVVFLDPLDPTTERRIRNIYSGLHLSGDFVSYTNLKDSLNFQTSHQSVGIQAADIIAGCFVGAIKNHGESVVLFNKYILPTLRKHPTHGSIKGCGVVSIPVGVVNTELTRLGITS